ncbi:MAG: hypothetical protein CSA66_04400 [Proteobacteria bacterium]|nr:MAG: hypothetical protein CSA66_04400 [Pseudomonadota bacterium]
MARLMTALIAALLLAGCFQHTFHLNTDQAPEAAPSFVDWNHHVLWGLVDTSGPVDVDALCPDGVAIVHNEMTVINTLLAVVTGGIYAPTTTAIYCARGADVSGY